MTTVGYRIEIDTRSGVANLKRLDRGFEEVGEGAQQTHRKVDLFTGALPKLGAAVAAAFSTAAIAAFTAKSVSAFGEFESALNDMAKVTDESLSAIETKIKSLDASLGNYTELTKGYYQVMSAGITEPEKAMDTLVTASKLAKVAHVEQAETVKGLTSVLEAYGDSLKNATEAGDLLLQMEAKGKTSVQELIPVIGKVAGLSSALSISSDQMAGIFSKITLLSGGTAFAATQYEALLSSMMRPTKEMSELFKEFGGAAEAIKKVGIEDVLKKIKKEAGDSAEKLGELFGQKEAIQAFIALFKDDFRGAAENIEAMTNKTGKLDDAWNKFEQSWEGISSKFRNTIGNILAEFGKELSPSLMNMMNDFSSWAKENKRDIVETAKAIGELAQMFAKVAYYAAQAIAVVPKFISGAREGMRLAEQAGVAHLMFGPMGGSPVTTDYSRLGDMQDPWMKGQPGSAGELQVKVKYESSEPQAEALHAAVTGTGSGRIEAAKPVEIPVKFVSLNSLGSLNYTSISERESMEGMSDYASGSPVFKSATDGGRTNSESWKFRTPAGFDHLTDAEIEAEFESMKRAAEGVTQLNDDMGRFGDVAIDLSYILRSTASDGDKLAAAMASVGQSMAGPAGGVAGGIWGQAVGNMLGFNELPEDGPSEWEIHLQRLDEALDRIAKAVEDFDKRMEMAGLDTAGKVTKFTELMGQKNEIESAISYLTGFHAPNLNDHYAIFSPIEELFKKYGIHEKINWNTLYNDRSLNAVGEGGRVVAALKELLIGLKEDMEDFREAIIEAGDAARQQAISLMESREAFYKDISRRDWSSDQWRQAYQTSAVDSNIALSDLQKLQAQLKHLTAGTDDYKMKQAEIALAQIAYADELEESLELEKQYINTLLDTITELRGLSASMDSLKTSLLEGELNPDQSFAWAQSHYDELLSAARSPLASNEEIEAYQNYVTTYLQKAREQFGSTAQYAEVFDRVLNSDIGEVQDALTTAIEANTAAVTANTMAMAGGAGYAEGGVSFGSDAGHYELLHGTEAIIPLGDGNTLKAPVQIAGDLNHQQIAELLKELIAAVNSNRVVVDGERFEGVIRQVSDQVRVDADNFGYRGRKMVS